jgi:hypothetical protein
MKTLSLIMAAFLLLIGVPVSRGEAVTRISNETGVPVATLQSERASTGLGWGEVEKANLLANASGKSFDDIVATHKAGEGWGKIAHDNGLNLGKIVSSAHRSDKAALHAQNAHSKSSVHGKSASGFSNGHASTMKGVGRGRSLNSGRGPVHSTGGLGHGHGGH